MAPLFGFALPGINISPNHGLMCLKVLERADVGQEHTLGIERGLSRSLEFREYLRLAFDDLPGLSRSAFGRSQLSVAV